MGRLRDGTVVPTPRDKVISSQAAAIFQKSLDGFITKEFIKFDIYYTDKTKVSGSSILDWRQAANTDVQVVVLYNAVGGHSIIHSMEEYTIGGITKTGPWMDDEEYWNLIATVHKDLK